MKADVPTPASSAPPFLAEAELRAHADAIAAIRTRSEALLAGLTDEQFNWRPAPGAWSLAQCLGHLSVSGALYLDSMEAAIAEAHKRGTRGRGPFKHGLLGNVFVRSMEPPAKLKVKNPRAFTPPPEQPLAEGSRAFFTVQDRIVRALQAANGLHLAKVKVPSPITPLVKLSLGQCFALLAAHERRHLWQAERLRSHPAFPR